LIVGITGGSASGKTTLALELTDRLADLEPLVLHQDRYFRDFSELPPEEREAARTANRPDAVVWPALIEHVGLLRSGQAAPAPPPGTRAHARGDATAPLQARHLVIVEGHLILWNAELRALMDLKLFLDVPVDERVLRRISRDVGRGGELERVVTWYRRDVLPNYPVFTETCRAFADLVLPFAQPNPVAVAAVAAAVRQMVRELQTGGERGAAVGPEVGMSSRGAQAQQ
jgi:uridine kinase